MTAKDTRKETFFNIRGDVIVCLFLVLATLAVYWQVRNHGFVNFDDPEYVTANRYVQAGLTSEGTIWAFTATFAGNWHPLTWLSHMLDCQLYGMNPGWHHLTNVLFHIANTLLLFLVFRRMTGDLWRVGFVAALFALHPLHVESVAWVAERKDVLSTLFWMLTMWSYVRYVENPRVNRYLLVLLLFILGLMAKPMLVTLPFVLLLLDYWPLSRFQLGQSAGGTNPQQRSIAPRLVLEKIPFLVLAAASSVATFLVQQSGGAVGSLPIHIRIINALASYISYIAKMIWPSHLAFFYPHPGMLPGWQIAAACLLLVSISFLVVRAVRRHPYLAVGWLWYMGTLVPVIGLVQVGSQAMADRYTYVPLIGMFIIIAWGVPGLVARWRHRQIGLAAIAAAILSILMATTWVQVRHWANSIALFEHALDVTANNHVAHNSLGVALAEQGRTVEAISHYSEALRIKTGYAEPHINLGVVLFAQGKIDEAIDHYSEALRIDPGFEKAHNNLGVALAGQGRTAEAIGHYAEALRINPEYISAHINLGIALASQGKINEAITHYNKALRIRPGSVEAHINLGNALAAEGKIEEAVTKIQEAIKLNPGNPALHYSLGNLYKTKGEFDEAMEQYQEALSIQPRFIGALNNLAIVYTIKKEYDRAISSFEKIIELRPDNAGAYYNIACIYARQDRIEESIAWLKKAIERGYKNWDLIKTDEDLENIRGSSYYEEIIRGH